MIKALEGGLGVFECHGFFDTAGVEAKGKGADAGERDEVDGKGGGGVEKGEGGREVEETGGGFGVGFGEDRVVGFVTAQDVEENLRTPLQGTGAALGTADAPGNEQAGLGDTAKLPFDELAVGEGLGEVGLGSRSGEEGADGFGGSEGLKRAEGEEEAVVIEGDEGVAAQGAADAQGDDAGEGVVGGASD